MKALKLAAVTMFHPIVGFNYMKKDRTHFNYLPIVVILVLMVFAKIFSMYVTHYPLRTVNLRTANLLMECLVVVVPVLLWVVSSYLLTTIMGGEVMFRECLMACCYSLLPYIIINIPMTIITNVLDANQVGLVNTINNIALLYVFLLLFINLKEMNHYTVLEAVGITILGLLTMILLCAVAALVAALTLRFVTFLQEVISEVSYKMIS